MQNLAALKELISLPKRIVITTHHSPDADALGSSLALSSYLLKNGHQVVVITPNHYPDFLKWMEGNDNVLIYEDEEEKAQYLVENADLIFCLDFSDLSRIGKLGELVADSSADKAMIDHHINPQTFATYVLWSTEAAATAELLYDLFEQLDVVDKITKGMAECMYAGLLTDTGNFKNPSTTPHVHSIVSSLMELGADVSKVNHKIYDENSFDSVRLLGYMLSEKLQVIKDTHTAYFTLTLDEKKKFSYQDGDAEGIVNYGLSIKDVVVSAIFIEEHDRIRISFRSFGEIPVNEFARKYFSGGGHKNCAGGLSFDSLEESIQKFEKLVHKKVEEFNYSQQ